MYIEAKQVEGAKAAFQAAMQGNNTVVSIEAQKELDRMSTSKGGCGGPTVMLIVLLITLLSVFVR
ncbi:MAG: hypothetical protein JWL77_3998 [Chthonomonadaceae bacterium]|nr:hypothetical protein [Chthonomonadaceae bacterium]